MNVLILIVLAILFIIVLDWLIAYLSRDSHSEAVKHRADQLSRGKK